MGREIIVHEKIFAELIQEIKTKKRFTRHKDMADLFKVTEPVIGSWLRGDTLPGTKHDPVISEALGISTKSLNFYRAALKMQKAGMVIEDARPSITRELSESEVLLVNMIRERKVFRAMQKLVDMLENSESPISQEDSEIPTDLNAVTKELEALADKRNLNPSSAPRLYYDGRFIDIYAADEDLAVIGRILERSGVDWDDDWQNQIPHEDDAPESP